MEKETFSFKQEQDSSVEDSREKSKVVGTEVLSTIKSPEEIVDTFDDAKRNGTVPEGVRDKQDYEEYKQEQNAKLNDAQKLIWETYYDENRIQERSEYKDRIMSFMGSEDLKVVVKSGFNLEGLFKDGILSKADGRYLDSPIPGLAKSLALDDAEKIIGDLADFCELIADKPDSDVLQDIFNDWSDLKLDADQYAMIDCYFIPNTKLRNRLMYGEVIDENGELTSSTCQVNHILHLIDTLPEISMRYGYSPMRELFVDKIETKPDEINQYVHNDIKSAFGEAAHKMFDSLLNDSRDHDEIARTIVKSVIATNDFDLMKKAKEAYFNDEEESVFSDEELLSSIYNIDPGDKTEKLYGNKEIGRKLPRHFEDLEKAGFSRGSLLNIIHDKNIPVHAEEVERMREAGVSNADIAYASRAYERFVVDKNGEREWYDAIDDDLLECKKEGYDPAFGLSDTDILNAANRNYWRNERMNEDADKR